MRISDDRYNRDRLRFDLAIRMMRHEARTCTIRILTGLTEDRVRKVFRAYLQHEPSQSVHRHRGKSPQMASYFLQSTVINFEATTLACLFYILGVVPRDGGGHTGPVNSLMTLDRAESLCLAYEAYAALHSSPRLSFEHAWFLLGLLLKNEELKLSSCGQCGRLYLTDAARARVSHCGCNAHRLGWPRRRRTSKSAPATTTAPSVVASVTTSVREMPADTLPAPEDISISIKEDDFPEESGPERYSDESMRHDIFL